MYVNNNTKRYKIEVRFIENFCNSTIWDWIPAFLAENPHLLRVKELIRLDRHDQENYKPKNYQTIKIGNDGKCIQKSVPSPE